MESRLLILGSTGSIGASTLNCVRRLDGRFVVAGLSAGKNADLLIRQIEEFSPPAVCIGDVECRDKIRQRFPGLPVYAGTDELEAFVNETDYDIVLNALVGAVGLRPTVAALRRNKRVALANKESLVIGGDYLKQLMASGSGTLIPVDSEHSAILQCLAGSRDLRSGIESIILTASGGPFRTMKKERFSHITIEEALNHPTWSMGKKITIDAATLMNKGFEVIEAHHLFNVSYDSLRVWIHPQSIIHSLVEFHDGAVMAQLGLPDMELPIQYALSYPDRLPMTGKRLSLPEIGKLDFFHPDFDRFPCLRLCIEAGKSGGTAPAVVNAANEVAVEAFLEGRIPFNGIAELVEFALEKHTVVPADSLDAIEHADNWARATITNHI
ncbi:MAG: 1-deoxy-D-xylulose-5-phosphate reductoisomerase [Chitinispirillaceae bacterium]|jgi:1-deoxy-D-xylulose-5-phosphate reductoisomerase|nr:1-deoxy-D-xylulose-5-phosphate reductoisomerase [Chitinispirillaceae bacterium]